MPKLVALKKLNEIFSVFNPNGKDILANDIVSHVNQRRPKTSVEKPESANATNITRGS